MPFTNAWDDTFPADTELANLIGSNLRQLRVDTQQRMAAISGLDAAKPNFAGDTQPANWNGILFFATDTGKVYRFTNPNWVEFSGIASYRTLPIVTSAFGGVGANGAIIYAGPNGVNSTTDADIRFPMLTFGTFRGLSCMVRSDGQSATGNMVVTLRKNGVSQALTVTIPAGAAGGTVVQDFAHTTSFQPGDKISVMIQNNATVAVGEPQGIGLVY